MILKPYKSIYQESKDVFDKIKQSSKEKGITLDLSINHNGVGVLHLLRVPKESRGQGFAKQIMQSICNIADKNRITLALTPTNEFGSSKNKLIAFYKSFGFVMNSGRNKDYAMSNTMFRLPKLNEDIKVPIDIGDEIKTGNSY